MCWDEATLCRRSLRNSQSTVQKGDRELGAQIRLSSAGFQGWLDSRDPNEVPTLLELEVSWERQIACKHKKDR